MKCMTTNLKNGIYQLNLYINFTNILLREAEIIKIDTDSKKAQEQIYLAVKQKKKYEQHE